VSTFKVDIEMKSSNTNNERSVSRAAIDRTRSLSSGQHAIAWTRRGRSRCWGESSSTCTAVERSRSAVVPRVRGRQSGTGACAELGCTDALCPLPSPRLFRQNVRVTRKFSNDESRRGTFMSQRPMRKRNDRVDFSHNFGRASDRFANGPRRFRSPLEYRDQNRYNLADVLHEHAKVILACSQEAKCATAHMECPRVSEDIEPFGSHVRVSSRIELR